MVASKDEHLKAVLEASYSRTIFRMLSAINAALLAWTLGGASKQTTVRSHPSPWSGKLYYNLS